MKKKLDIFLVLSNIYAKYSSLENCIYCKHLCRIDRPLKNVISVFLPGLGYHLHICSSNLFVHIKLASNIQILIFDSYSLLITTLSFFVICNINSWNCLFPKKWTPVEISNTGSKLAYIIYDEWWLLIKPFPCNFW